MEMAMQMDCLGSREQIEANPSILRSVFGRYTNSE